MPNYKGYTNWKGRELTEDEAREWFKGLPICPYCDQHVNTMGKPLEAHHQTKAQVLELLADARGVMSAAGEVRKECFAEHHEPFLRYVRFVRQGDELRELPYEEEERRTGRIVGGVFGIWPIVK